MPRFLTPLFAVTFTLLLVGKFYYFTHGWHSHLQPLAPAYLILLKDAILFGFLGIFFPILCLTFPQDKAPTSKKIMLFIVLLSALSALHLIHLPVSTWFQYYVRNSLLYLSIILISYQLIDSNKIDLFFKIIVAVCMLNAALVGLSFLFWKEKLFDHRAIGLCDNPNTLAGLFTFGFAILITNYFYLKKARHLIGALVLTAATFGTVSLSYVLFQLILCLVLFVLYAPKAKIQLLLISVVTFISYHIMGLLVPDFSDSLLRRIGSISANPMNSNTVLTRIKNYDRLMENTFSGNFATLLFGDFSSYKFITFDSSLLVLIINFGLLGFLLCMYPVCKSLYLSYRHKPINSDEKRKRDIIVASISLFILSGMVHNVFNRFPLNVIFYAEMGMLFQIIINSKRAYKGRKKPATNGQQPSPS